MSDFYHVCRGCRQPIASKDLKDHYCPHCFPARPSMIPIGTKDDPRYQENLQKAQKEGA